MTHDIKVLTAWIFACVLVAAVGTTLVPILYAFFPWRMRPIGKLFMLQSIAFALAIDLTALFMLWPTQNILLLFWLNAFIFTFIAGVSISLAVWFLTKMCIYPRKKDRQDAASQ
jgi:hypothetical protein